MLERMIELCLPDSPPVFIFRMGRRVFTSMRIPRRVLMRESASAPPW